ncbi:MAG: undecaprenyl-diphosphate phosphatase [Geminicoccaceae bacterium]|nr:undecaprenyl-diphosphate phosphatase [Geminicoccaceae bacterium]
MDLTQYFEASLLGLIEGLTEFIPVSSTGHLILLINILGFEGPPGKVFEVVIQLGAIFAVCWAYRERLIHVALRMFSDPSAFAFVRNIVLAFLPAAVLGVLLHGFIKSVLFNPWVVSVALIVGGILIIVIERRVHQPKPTTIETMSPLLAIKVGLCQTLAMIPGVSRSGATIMGGLLLGLERKVATEFSFFLAIPTMLGATVYDLYKNRDVLSFDDAGLIAVGFVIAFLAALAVVRSVIAFISKHGFVPFAWYRIALGIVMLVLLSMWGVSSPLAG